MNELIILQQPTNNVLNSLFGDPRTWTLVATQGFFTGLGVLVAQLIGNQSVARLFNKEEKEHRKEVNELRERLVRLEEKE